MKINDCYSYVNQKMKENGIVSFVPHIIRIDRYFTEEQKEENRKYAETHSDCERAVRCEERRKEIADKIHTLMEELDKRFSIGQYKNKNNYNYDFWFWCNYLEDKTNIHTYYRDYSYVTLTVEDKHNVERNEKLWEDIRKFLEEYEVDGIQVFFQYGQIVNEEEAKKKAIAICKALKNKNVYYYSGVKPGKLSYNKNDDTFTFRPKYAHHTYRILAYDICNSELFDLLK